MSVREPQGAMIQYACGDEHNRLLDATERLHADYCDQFGINYRVTRESRAIGNRPPHWRKVELLIDALKVYKRVVWIDTDCVIVDASFNLFDASGFGIAVCECFDSPTIERHLNTGVLIATRSPDVIGFMDTWNAMPIGGRWEDQSAFIELMAFRPNRDLLTILPNRFNCLDNHMEARSPIVRAFHGNPDRQTELPALVKRITHAGA